MATSASIAVAVSQGVQHAALCYFLTSVESPQYVLRQRDIIGQTFERQFVAPRPRQQCYDVDAVPQILLWRAAVHLEVLVQRSLQVSTVRQNVSLVWVDVELFVDATHQAARLHLLAHVALRVLND
jgi:hypothetical protein